jgi:hypothetical protein
LPICVVELTNINFLRKSQSVWLSIIYDNIYQGYNDWYIIKNHNNAIYNFISKYYEKKNKKKNKKKQEKKILIDKHIWLIISDNCSLIWIPTFPISQSLNFKILWQSGQ